MEKKITVFTPAYNREALLPRLYQSLLDQERQDFVWLIVDDGSTDNTRVLIEAWIQDGKIEIRYFYKPNGGLHTAYNLGIDKADTELFVCIDSDDYLPKTALDRILRLWDEQGGEKYAGIVGLDYSLDNKPIGDRLPDQKSIHFIDIKMNHRGIGDTKLVHRTSLLKKYIPMPVFQGEKNFNPSYIFLKVDQDYPLLILNENICFVDYQQDGMSMNILHQYRNSPNSFMELRRLYLTLPNTTPSYKLRHIVHYVSSCMFAGRWKKIIENPYPLLSVLLLPLGLGLNLYIRSRTSR